MIDQILQKLGIRSIDDLKPAERATWMQWTSILAKGDVTIEDLKKLLPIELERARDELLKYENSKEKDLFHKAYITALETITKIVTTPTQERENLKSMLIKKYGLE
jgi:hypothetical protein